MTNPEDRSSSIFKNKVLLAGVITLLLSFLAGYRHFILPMGSRFTFRPIELELS